jgi:predicted enzyme related to lactoylglutathione lyase
MGRVVHFEIHCHDLDRAERFYASVFGWKIERWEGAPIDYRLVTTGDEGPGINGALTERRGEVDGTAVIAYVNTIEVDDIEATERAVVEAGGEQVTERHEIPGVGQHTYFKDTEGNIFGALESEPGA